MGEIAKVEVTPIAGGPEPDKPMAVENKVGAHAGKLLISLIRSSRKIDHDLGFRLPSNP
jgi:hypothetical protein